MFPDHNLSEKGLLIITGSSPRAEQADRPLAYRLRDCMQKKLSEQANDYNVVVLGDLWYLNCESLQRLPMISLGGPGVNAVAAHLYKRLANALVVDNTLLIQMDPHYQDLRVSIWGMDHQTTVEALELFVQNGYLERFLGAVTARLA